MLAGAHGCALHAALSLVLRRPLQGLGRSGRREVGRRELQRRGGRSRQTLIIYATVILKPWVQCVRAQIVLGDRQNSISLEIPLPIKYKSC